MLTAQSEPQDCFACGRAFIKGDGRFCSTRCRDAFDNGFPPYMRDRGPIPEKPWRHVAGPPFEMPPELPRQGDGCLIECRGCRRQFVSRGLRCCSTECERKHRERQEIEAIMAEVGVEAAPKR
jgi:hypothetical protein